MITAVSNRMKPFRTPHTFGTAGEAVAYFNGHRVEGVQPIPAIVLTFLESIADYDPLVVFNVQPSLNAHYVAVARPDDHHPWLFAKPGGVVFQLGDERNVEAMIDMWGDPMEPPPLETLDTDLWFAPVELSSAGAEFALRLAAQWAVYQR